MTLNFRDKQTKRLHISIGILFESLLITIKNLKFNNMRTIKNNPNWIPALFDNLLNENRLDVNNWERFSTPAVNISDNNTSFVLEFAVPGFKKDDFTIEVEKDSLKVSSKSVQSDETTEKKDSEAVKFTRKEFNFSKFERTFTLPETVNSEEIKATYENGILKIELPKVEVKEVKRMVEIS